MTATKVNEAGRDAWPVLPYVAWQETYATLHLWTQIVGKIRLSLTPWLNHSWHVALYVTTRGLTTSPIAYGARTFQIDFDFIDHVLRITTSDSGERQLQLRSQTVADFYSHLFAKLAELDIFVRINEHPNEMPDALAFTKDRIHGAYDPAYVSCFWRLLAQADRVFKIFRTGFVGKASPVHFFWGSFDLAATRFSGRRAPRHPGGVPNLPDAVVREAYSHEVSSAGFWPGGGSIDFPVFYSYAYPAPPGFDGAPVEPEGAFFSQELKEFILPYDVVRKSERPDATLLRFLQSTYEAAADAGGWDRVALECPLGHVGAPRRGSG
ncbi:MAG TPA: DUF5996 family protein [Methylocystis sp.]|jgi:hypothetical protein